MPKKKLTPNQQILAASQEFGKAISIDGSNLSETQWANLVFYVSSITRDSVLTGVCSSTGTSVLPTFAEISNHVTRTLKALSSKVSSDAYIGAALDSHNVQQMIANQVNSELDKYIKQGALPSDWMRRSEQQRLEFFHNRSMD